MTEQKQSNPLMVVAGWDCFYLQAASGEYVAKVIGDSVTAKLKIEHICKAANEYSALCSVAEAAETFKNYHVGLIKAQFSNRLGEDVERLKQALAALAKLRS